LSRAQNYSEEEIINGCKKGKPQFQEALYNLYGSRMMGVCLRYAQDSMEAEDVFQETFIKVFSKIERFKGGSFKSWIYTIFINSSIDNYRSNKQRHLHVSYDDIIEQDNGDVDVLKQMSANEITEIINKMPEGYRLVFNLFVVDGYSHKEISEMLSISEGTSKSQLFKAKAMLVKLMEDNNIARYAI
jgi:RNA polymerase sigma factor (sigma-70 family)